MQGDLQSVTYALKHALAALTSPVIGQAKDECSGANTRDPALSLRLWSTRAQLSFPFAALDSSPKSSLSPSVGDAEDTLIAGVIRLHMLLDWASSTLEQNFYAETMALSALGTPVISYYNDHVNARGKVAATPGSTHQ